MDNFIQDVGKNENLYYDACNTSEIPSATSYFSAIGTYGILMLVFGGILVLMVLLFYIHTMRYLFKNSSSNILTPTMIVIAVCPAVSIVTFFANIFPRSYMVGESIAHGMFTFAIYKLFCLILEYCGGEQNLIKNAKINTLISKVPPCCCCSCCVFLPKLPVNTKNMLILRLMVLQLPILQSVMYMVLYIIKSEEKNFGQTYTYIQLYMFIPMLISVWGVMIMIKSFEDILQPYHLKKKFIALKLILLFAKLQGLAGEWIPWNTVFLCTPPITPQVQGNLLCNLIMLMEMVLLAYWTKHLYTKELPIITEYTLIDQCTQTEYINLIDQEECSFGESI